MTASCIFFPMAKHAQILFLCKRFHKWTVMFEDIFWLKKQLQICWCFVRFTDFYPTVSDAADLLTYAWFLLCLLLYIMTILRKLGQRLYETEKQRDSKSNSTGSHSQCSTWWLFHLGLSLWMVSEHVSALFCAKRNKSTDGPFEAVLNLLLFFQEKLFFNKKEITLRWE